MWKNPVFYTLLFIPWLGSPARANDCIADSALLSGPISAILPSFIGGSGKLRTKFVFQMNCDTMVVPSGDTTTIATNTLLHFPERRLSNRVILVEGTLKILGESKHSVILAGSKKVSDQVGAVPGGEKWGGIRVAESGALIITHADFFNADTALYVRSDRFSMDAGYFSHCYFNIFPDGKMVALMDEQYQTFNEKIPSASESKLPPLDSEAKPKKSNDGKSNLWWWAGSVLGGGAAIYGLLLWQPWEEKQSPHPNPDGESPFTIMPNPPGKPDPL